MSATAVPPLATGRWVLDPAHSTAEFAVRHFYGLMTVRGSFAALAGTLDLDASPAIELTIEAASIDTGNRRRDEHLRGADFFDVQAAPQVRFVSETATLNEAGDTLAVHGQLHAAGQRVPLELDVAVLAVDGGGLALEATTEVDHRRLGMTWSPLGILRSPSTLTVRARLVAADEA